MNKKEKDYRLGIINELLITPHKDLSKTAVVHKEVMDQDPYFYARLGLWYSSAGKVRDHTEVFIANLLASKQPDHREAGFVLLQKMPPYQVARVVSFMKLHFGKVPRSTRTAVVQYLRKREANDQHFDTAAVRARKAFRSLYASLHIKPSKRANLILFQNDPPEGSLARVIKALSKVDSPTEQARILVNHKIPYPIAVGIIKTMTPTILVALINSMSPNEVINNMNSLNARGAMDHKEVKELINQKLEAAKTDKRASAYKARVAAEAAGLDDETTERLEAVTDAQVKTGGAITRQTALLVDKSSSMDQAIEMGKQLAALISGVAETDFYCYAFDSAAFQVKPKGGNELSHWANAFKTVHASGMTSLGSGIAALAKANQVVEQIVVITDEGHNSHPSFSAAWKVYSDKFGVTPNVVIIRVPNSGNYVSNECKYHNIQCDTVDFNGDYYSLPNIVPLLAQKSCLDLLMDILGLDLPERTDSPQRRLVKA
jgi:hypothetical protein